MCLSESLTLPLSPSLRLRCCVSLSADSRSALFRCLVLSWGRFSGDPVFTSLFYHTFDKSALFVHTQKCLSFLLFALVFASDVFFPLWHYLFILCRLVLLSFSQSVCLWFAVLSIHFKFNLMMTSPFLFVSGCL